MVSSKVIITVAIGAAIIVAAIVVIGSYPLLNTALAPLEHREDKAFATPMQNVAINATTINGDIQIQTTTGSQIEVTYNIAAPKEHLNDVETSTTNRTISENTLEIVAQAKIVKQDSGGTVNHRANILIKLPSTSRYNLTLITLNGDIIKPQLNDTSVMASTNNGNIDIKDDGCVNIDAISMNGDVKVGLAQGTLFQVIASAANGDIIYQGIVMNTSIHTATQLKGATSAGQGNLNLTLIASNGNITIEYLK